MDGTFSAHPKIFAQLYTVHIKLCDEFFPQLWCLLPDKQGVTYVRLFQLLKQAAVNANMQLVPAIVHVDFEMAVIQAIRAEFLIEPTGCMFHYSQSILRHVQQCGLQASYNTNIPPETRTWIRRLIALPLLPPLRIDQAFQAVVANAPNVAGRDTMNDYVRDTYVDVQLAIFPRDTWNCYGEHDRTTNVCEGYHSVLSKHFHNKSPDPFQFVEFLQEQDMQLERRLAQLQNGAPPKKRKTKYVLVDDALDRLREQYFAGGLPNVVRVLQYMDAVGHQLYDVKH
jgi:MULE transposase domain